MVNFFANGVLIKSYSTHELHLRGRKEWRQEPWHRYKAITVALNENELTVETINKNVFVFDITTGELISEQIIDNLKDSQTRLIFVSILIFAVIVIVIILILMKRKNTRKGEILE